MSTIQALVHSSSTIFTMDLYARIRTGASQDHLIKTGRIATASLLIMATLLSPIVTNFENIFEFFQKCWALIAAPIAAVFVLAIFWKRTSKAAAFWTLMLVLPMFLLPHGLQMLERHVDWRINEYNLAGLLLLLSLAFAIVISLLTKAPAPEQIEGLVWNPSLLKMRKGNVVGDYPWYKNLWLWCGIWVAVMVALYAVLW